MRDIAGYNAKVAAENVGTGQASLDEVIKGWQQSPGHNKNLLLADVLSDIGTFMQSVGAAWLMLSLGAGPIRAFVHILLPLTLRAASSSLSNTIRPG